MAPNAGEKQDITFTLLVDARSAPALNEKGQALDDILVLHLEKGKDIFVVVSGKWQKSPFGASLDELMANNGPVRPLPAPVCRCRKLVSPSAGLGGVVRHVLA